MISAHCAHPGHIEAVLLNNLKQGKNGVEVERAIEPIDMQIDEDAAANSNEYPVSVTIKHLSEKEAGVWASNAHTVLSDGTTRDEPSTKTCPSVPDGDYQTMFQQSNRVGQTETIRAKYVIGAEGAHSWIRKKLGISMNGSASESAWGVVDIAPITDYPE